jgi:hypothetical protein
MVAAKRAAGLVEHERPIAVRAGLDVTAIAAQHDRRGPATVDHEDRLVAARSVKAVERRREPAGEQPAVALAQLLAQVDDLDDRRLA